MDLLILESEYLAFSKHFKSTGTYRYDKSHLPTIINFLQDSGYTDTSQLDFEALYLFIDQSRIHDNSNATINKRISLLNRSIAFQVKQGKCEPTIIASFPKLKEIDKRYSIIDEATMRKVIAYLLNLPDNFLNIRNRLIIFLFIDTGARLSEVTNIFIENIDTSNCSILLSETKTKRERVVFFTEYTLKHLTDYLSIISKDSGKLLLNSKSMNPINYLGVLRVFQKVKKALNLKEFSSHMVRHSYGTLAYKKDINNLFTKNTMGHSRMDMTERYTHYDIETNKKIFNSLSPMEHYLDIKK